MNNQKGFANIIVIIGVVVIAGIAGYFVLNQRTRTPPVPTPTPTPVITPNPIINPPPISEQVNPPSNTTGGVIGILNVVTNCMIPEGCWPKYSLWDSEFKSFTPLVSNNIIKDSDSGLIVRVSGSEVTYGCDIMLCPYNSPTKGIEVSAYSVLSKIPYRDFLISKSSEYTLQKYPCLAVKEYGGTKYIKDFSWEFTNNVPMIKVRMTDTWSGVEPQTFYELWYNGNSGSFIKEINYPEGKVFCQ